MRGRLAAKKCTDGSSVIFSYDSKDYLKSSSVMLPGQKLEPCIITAAAAAISRIRAGCTE